MGLMDISDLYDKISKMFANNVLHSDAIIPQTSEYYVNATIIGALDMLLSDVKSQLRELNIETACCDNLISLGAKHNYFRRSRSYPGGIIRITGKCGALLSNNLTFNIKGTRFKSILVPSDPITNQPRIDGKGEAFIFVRTDTFVDTELNISKGTEGELVDNLVQVDKKVILVSGICQSIPEESCEQFRARLMDAFRYKQQSYATILNNIIWDFPCLPNLTVIENPRCCAFYNTTINSSDNCLIVMPNFDESLFDNNLSKELLHSLELYLFGNPNGSGLGKMPINVCGRVINVTKAEVDISIIFAGNIPYKSELDRLREELMLYVNMLPIGSSLFESDVVRILYDVLGEKYKNNCINFKEPLNIASITNKSANVACDVKIIPIVHFYNSEGNEIGL